MNLKNQKCLKSTDVIHSAYVYTSAASCIFKHPVRSDDVLSVKKNVSQILNLMQNHLRRLCWKPRNVKRLFQKILSRWWMNHLSYHIYRSQLEKDKNHQEETSVLFSLLFFHWIYSFLFWYNWCTWDLSPEMPVVPPSSNADWFRIDS